MNRSELHYALNATLPHVGKRPPYDVLGLQSAEGDLYLCATDGYTIGVAKIPHGPALNLSLSPSEATDLMRFVRPTVKATLTEDVAVGVRPGELHIGLSDSDDSAVFETVEHDPRRLPALLDFAEHTYRAPVEYAEQVYSPDLFAKFAKAKREDADRLRLYPRRTHDKYGRALVTVGDLFIGVINAMTYSEPDAALAAFALQNKGIAA